jgi:hypothetical protein
MKLVKFKDGKFGLKKFGFYGTEYFYFTKEGRGFWTNLKTCPEECRTSEHYARVMYERMTDKGEVVE